VIKDPTRLHSPGAFNTEGGDGPELIGCRIDIKSAGGKSWTTAFADACIHAASADKRVVAITAAMPDGTGLSKFERALPDQYLDTGICESHLMAMAAGMAKVGQRPIAAIYSTFVQRAFDQIWQEVILNKQPVVIAMDRAGFVGDDGPVHHGFMDQSFLRPLPGIVLMAPSDEAELNAMLGLGLSLETARAIRYPRDSVPAQNFAEVDDALADSHPRLSDRATAIDDAKAADGNPRALTLGRSRRLRVGDDATLVVYGALMTTALAAAVFEIGRHSATITVSPSLASPFSSCTCSTVRRLRYLPYFGCLIW
jgi:deoxyxylulose-5-phosphate synthase